MATEVINIRTIDLNNELIHKPAGVPHGWLVPVHNKMMANIPPEEHDKVKILGIEKLVYSYEHTLTPVEELTGKLEKVKASLTETRWKELTPESLEDAIKSILKDLT